MDEGVCFSVSESGGSGVALQLVMSCKGVIFGVLLVFFTGDW